jgi:hypothetical protein
MHSDHAHYVRPPSKIFKNGSFEIFHPSAIEREHTGGVIVAPD